MIRRVSLLLGVCLVVVAFAAATHVANTRDGLIAEVVTEFAALAGICLILYGIFASAIRSGMRAQTVRESASGAPVIRPVRDLVTGGAGLLIAIVLLAGISLSAGIQWAALGVVLLLPMIAGSIYLCARFVTAPSRSWKLQLRKPDRQNQA